MTNIAIFASGSGTNAENIIKYFSNKNSARVRLVLSNKPDAMVLRRAERLGIDSCFFDYNDLYVSSKVLSSLKNHDIDFIVLAGFLWLIPSEIINNYECRIVNIHPALLPLYGGKGMYGDSVHKAVIAKGEKESGITIHYVNEQYDSGSMIFQARCPVFPGDTHETLASRIHKLEYEHYPRVIENLVKELPVKRC